MIKKIVTVSSLTLMGVLSISEVSALSVKVQNYTGKQMHLFFRPTASKMGAKSHIIVVPPTPEGTYQVVKFDEKPGIKGCYDVIAAETHGNPDWKFLGGTCKDIHRDREHRILIESSNLGLTTTCTQAE